MKIMIFDVPAESGGALSILNQYYDRALKDSKNEYYFIVSTPNIEEKDNIRVLRFPWIKKSWVHRYFFDKFLSSNLVKKYKIDEVLSLQNIIIPRVKVPQGVYVHQPLPFIKNKFSFFSHKKYWVYQNIIGALIKKSIAKSDYVIVQTEWMKKSITPFFKGDESKILLEQPKIKHQLIEKFNYKDKDNFSRFFFPASDEIYKNHILIVKAAIELVKSGRKDFEIFFTISNTNSNSTMLESKKLIKEYSLPIYFVDKLEYEEVFTYYSNSILIFPSYIETFGLPLLEAKLSETVVLSVRESFSEEILSNYSHKYFFDYTDYISLAKLMKNQMDRGKEIYVEQREKEISKN